MIRLYTLFLSMVASPLVAGADGVAPYAGEQARAIKALSQLEVEGYLQGRGMGYAKAAELNHFPGPRHVLDMAKELGIDGRQLEQTQVLFESMRSRAVSLGEQIVDKEAQLDRQFAGGSIQPEVLKELLSDIGALQAELRYVHLEAHLKQRALLTQQQILRYDELRGYEGTGTHMHDHAH